MTEKRKILYIIEHIDWFWSHRYPLAAAARDQGMEVHVAVAGAANDKRLTAEGFIPHELPAGHGRISPVHVIRTFLRVHRILKKIKPDLVHIMTLKYAVMAGPAARLHPRTRTVYTVAGLGYLFSEGGAGLKILAAPVLKMVLRDAAVIVQNPDDRDLLISQGFVKPAQSMLVAGSGVDLEQFSYVREPKDEEPLVLMPTRLLHDKGVAVFAEAARILRERGARARFQIAGGTAQDNPMAIAPEEMEAILADTGAEWIGRVADMPRLLAAATIVAYPSYYREGIPKVLLEAAAAGRAIVTTDHPGCREAVADGVSGVLVPVKDPEALAEAIEALLRDPEGRAAMGAAGRRLAEERFDVRKVVADMLRVYG